MPAKHDTSSPGNSYNKLITDGMKFLDHFMNFNINPTDQLGMIINLMAIWWPCPKQSRSGQYIFYLLQPEKEQKAHSKEVYLWLQLDIEDSNQNPRAGRLKHGQLVIFISD